MAVLPKRVLERLKNLVKFQSVLKTAKDKDINETDTVHIVKDILSDVFGYDKYLEITSEFAIKNTYCDLAIKINEKVQFLIEAKAIGKELKEAHLKQVTDYGAHHGTNWIILTNGLSWQLHRLNFTQPISTELICSLQFDSLNLKKDDDLERLFVFSREGLDKNAREEYHEKTQFCNKFVLGTILQEETVLNTIRKELKKLAPEIRVEIPEIHEMLKNEVIKREIIEDEEALKAQQKVKKIYQKIQKKANEAKEVAKSSDSVPVACVASVKESDIPAENP